MATSASSQISGEIHSARRWLVAIAVMASVVMELVDTSAVNVSIPYIAGNLSATIDEATWVLTSYLVSNAIVLPLTGWLASRVGRKRLLMTAVAGFTTASMLCGLAPTLATLIACRILQGAFGGALQPTTRAILLETFPREERGRAMAVWGVGIVVAPIVAPVLGGWLTTDYSWRWVFFINLPISILGLILVDLYVFDPPYLRRTAKGIDYWGVGMLVLGIASLQIVLDKGQEADWFSSRFILTLTVVAAVSLVAFVIWELIAQDPMVHLRLLKYRTFGAGVSLSLVLFFVLYGSILLLPLFMQVTLNFPAITAGVWNCPRGIATMALMPVAGFLIGRRWDMRKLLFGGILVSALGVLSFSFLDLTAGPWNFLAPQIVMGAGMAFVFVPFSTITVDPIPNEEMGYATSITALARNLGASFGISIAATMLQRRDQVHQVRLAAHVTSMNPLTANLLSTLQDYFHHGGADLSTAGHQALGALYSMVQVQASVLSYLDEFRLLAAMFLLVSPLVWVMRKPHFKSEGGEK
ncbi:MAG TPA: DHA2 family efflux MFS transporter permease subunit [Terriglobia bacterium]|nr:DHA2 family efflux MFS transporter permease subunit [Terriglobia bacterium]